MARPFKQAHIPDWTKFRQSWQDTVPIHTYGYQAWSQQLVSSLRVTETHIKLSEAVSDVDNHLLHLWEARNSLTGLAAAIRLRDKCPAETHGVSFAPSLTPHKPALKRRNLQRAIHGFAGNTTQLAHKLRDQYLCTTQDTPGTAYSYAGSESAELDQPSQLQDLKGALAKMKRGTAPGRDKITVKLLANLPDTTYNSLLAYFNSTWLGEVPLPIEW
ncbi:hypothetical protein HPB49_011890 [Dermacentor silvarum]|uniref:Uncharacterized protein n=1 Tax=Dermacentor silvarum TaxID=543639 RepID=A0ACB8C3F1_DERSI|nr:hypothetical protein HPB49_011890 [Dermacentor silvarum]